MHAVGESSSVSIDNSVSHFPSESRALIGSSTGLAEREISNCGTANVSLLACGSETGNVPSSTRESRLRGSFCRKPSSLPTLSMLLKYYQMSVVFSCGRTQHTLTVLTCSSSVASSSTTIIGCGCNWRLDSVHIWFTPPSMHFCKAKALCAPVMMMTTSRA
jgi:hypothetical protein